MQKIAKKTVVIIGVVTIFGFWAYHKIEHHRSGIEQFVRYNWPSNSGSAVTATPKVSELSARIFSDVNEGLLSSCVNNQLGLTREDCVQTVHDRKELCQRQTIQKFPETTASPAVMQEVVSSHVACIFRTPSSIGE